MDVLRDFMLLSLRKKIQEDRHDVIIADFSKWSNLLEILYKYSSCSAYSYYYVVFTLIKTKMKYGRYGSHCAFFSKRCDDYSSRTTNGRDMGFSSHGSFEFVELPV